MIHVIAGIQVNPDKVNDFLKVFHRLIPKVLEEEGCIEYGITRDEDIGLDAAEPLRQDVLTVVEKWASPDALRAHLQTPHMEEYHRQVGDWVEGVSIRILRPV